MSLTLLPVPLSLIRLLAIGCTLAITIVTFVAFSPLFGGLMFLLLSIVRAVPRKGILLLFLLLPVGPIAPLFGSIHVSYSELALASCLIVWLLVHAFSSRPYRLDCKPLLWGSGFMAAVALSGLVHTDWYKVVPHVLRQSGFILAAFLAANTFCRSNSDRDLRAALAVATLVFPGWELIQQVGATRLASFFSNPNQFAGYLLLLLPFLLICLFSARGSGRFFWGMLFLMTIGALYLTGSRAATFAGTVSSVVALSFAFRRWPEAVPQLRSGLTKPRGLLLLLALMIGSLVLAWFWSGATMTRVASRYRLELLQKGLEGRTLFFELGYAIWSDHPLLGVGPGRYDDSLPEYLAPIERSARKKIRRELLVKHPEWENRYPWRLNRGLRVRMERLSSAFLTHVHNLPLQLAVDFGLLGMLAFGTFLVWAFRECFVRARSSLWSCAGIAMLVGFCLHNMLDVTIPSLGLETGILLGIAIANVKPSESKRNLNQVHSG